MKVAVFIDNTKLSVGSFRHSLKILFIIEEI